MRKIGFADKFICMINIKDEGKINSQRSQHLLAISKVIVSITGLNIGSALAAPTAASSKNKPTTPNIPKPEKRSITLATTSPSALPFLPLLVAQHKGFFAQQGLELQWSEQQSAARAITAVANGQADMVCGWLENMLSAPGRALGLQSFVTLGNAPMMCLGVPVRTNNTSTPLPTKLAELSGRKIGIIALNSPTHTVALAALRRAGLRATDVGFVSVGSAPSAAMALRSGQIDALVHLDPLMLELEQRGEIVMLCDMRSPYAAYEALGMHLPSGCVAAPQEFLQRYPDTAQACSDALVQALQWLQQASLRDILLLQRSLPESMQAMEPQSFVASYERLRLAYSSDGVCSLKSAQDLLQAMHDAEPALRLEKIDLAKSINNVLVQRSLARLKT